MITLLLLTHNELFCLGIKSYFHYYWCHLIVNALLCIVCIIFTPKQSCCCIIIYNISVLKWNRLTRKVWCLYEVKQFQSAYPEMNILSQIIFSNVQLLRSYPTLIFHYRALMFRAPSHACVNIMFRRMQDVWFVAGTVLSASCGRTYGL